MQPQAGPPQDVAGLLDTGLPGEAQGSPMGPGAYSLAGDHALVGGPTCGREGLGSFQSWSSSPNQGSG